jgi:UDP-N-acetylmuramate-alanine ligase
VLRKVAESRDTVLIMGAGDISRVGDELLEMLPS